MSIFRSLLDGRMPVHLHWEKKGVSMPSRRGFRLARPAIIAAVQLTLFVGIAAIPAGVAQAQAEDLGTEVVEQYRDYDIAAGSLAGALNQFAAEAGVYLSAPGAITRGKSSPGISGRYSVQQGFSALLDGSGLMAVRQADDVWLLRDIGSATLSPVVVTATRTEREVANSTASVEVIDAAMIRDSGATMLDEVLRKHAGLHTSSDGTTVSIRGVNREDVLYLINGRRMSGESSRRYEPNRISAAQIERIEIVKGPGSVMYGSDALGGVINIITHRPEGGFYADVDLQVGARATGGAERYVAALTLGGGSEDTQYAIFANVDSRQAWKEQATAEVGVTGNRTPPSTHGGSASPVRNIQDHYTFDEYRRDEADVYGVGGVLQHRFNERLHVELEASLTDEQRETNYINEGRTDTNYAGGGGDSIPAFNTPTRWVDDNRRTDLSLALDWSMSDVVDLRYRIYRSQYDKGRAVTVIPWQDYGYDSEQDSDVGARNLKNRTLTNEMISTWRPNSSHTLLLGYEHRDGNYESDKRWESGLFAQHEWALTNAMEVIYGVRHDKISIGEEKSSIKAGMVHALGANHRVRVNYAQGFKVPEGRDYNVSQVNPSGRLMLGAHVEDPSVGKTRHELGPESSDTWELGFSGHIAKVVYSLTLFQTDIDDRVERVLENPAGTEYLTFRNVGNARIRGVELGGKIPLAANLDVDVNTTWLDAVNRDIDRELTNAPSFSGLLGINWRPLSSTKLRMGVRHQGGRYRDAENTDKDESYTLVDLMLNYRPARMNSVELYGGVDNLADTGNRTSLYSDPGRFLRAGMRWSY